MSTNFRGKVEKDEKDEWLDRWVPENFGRYEKFVPDILTNDERSDLFEQIPDRAEGDTWGGSVNVCLGIEGDGYGIFEYKNSVTEKRSAYFWLENMKKEKKVYDMF